MKNIMRKRDIANMRATEEEWKAFHEGETRNCPVCGSTTTFGASVPTVGGQYTWQNLYIKCNDDQDIGCRAELSVLVDFEYVSNGNDVLIAAWNVMAKRESNE